MKVKSVTPLDDGMGEFAAKTLWDMLEGFAAYSFNKSHSYEYSLISWITMWLKVYYPAEFFAGALSVVDDEDRQSSLIIDAQGKHLQILPPDILKSTQQIEIEGEDKLYAPFQAVKGISEGTAAAIVEARGKTGTFTFVPAVKKMTRRKNKETSKFELVEEEVPAHLAELSTEAQKELFGRTKVNARAMESLDKVGAFVCLSGGLPALHPDRLRDRLELMPGFTVEVVKADRLVSLDHLTKIKITALIEDVKVCKGCTLHTAAHPVMRMGEKPKFMLVFDNPTWQDEKSGALLSGDGGELIKAALKDQGLKVSQGYYTTLVKGYKPKTQKALSNEQINGCTKWLDQEIALLKPPVIVAMGSNAIRYFAPGVKGTPADLAGKAIYRADLDCTVIFGLNPASIFFDASKVKLIEQAFAQLAEVLT